MSYQDNLIKSLYTGFIDSAATSLEEYQPALLVNDRYQGIKVLTSIVQELTNCDEFLFSVAFITNSGVSSLIELLRKLEEKGIRGRILASQYQNFTQPEALRRLISLKNIDVKIVVEDNFHAKGYIFRKGNQYSLIVGSSNLTQNALSVNKEWNLKVHSTADGTLIKEVVNEYNRTFDGATQVTEEWIKEYVNIYEESYEQKVECELYVIHRISPNSMQVEALKALEKIRAEGNQRALLISATGTGKTYLSAFDLKKAGAERFLFVVHRENIAKAAMKSYKKIFGPEISMGLLTGNEKNEEADFIFSTIQTLSKEETLNKFERDVFDYIVIDEVHRSGAASYQRIIEYFKPKFLLGMSATPERTDGFDIFKLFDYKIAYEFRLNRALEENMLSPFHYYGISEIMVDGKLLDTFSSFNNLICDERVNRIIEAADLYGCDYGRVKGLIFCSRTEEAKALSEKFNQRGFNTVCLTGGSSEKEREDAIDRLESNDENYLDYIFTVDIFNEGVDIPSLNQIIMLRPTQSAIVFVQQLGRGLRKAPRKEYLVVIDFIGNYDNNYLIPIALYGDKSYNKDNIRKLITSGSSFIPGASTVNFDEITRQRIYSAIDKANMTALADMRNDYKLLKYQLGHIPTMVDFVEHGNRDPYLFVDYSNSYYNFIKRVDDKFSEELPLKSEKLLQFVSKELCNGKRLEELLILKSMIKKKQFDVEELISHTKDDFGYMPSDKTLQSAINSVNGLFVSDNVKEKYLFDTLVKENDGKYECSEEFEENLENNTLRSFLLDAVEYGVINFSANFSGDKYIDGLSLYSKYSRKDVCRILNWDKDESSTVYGYRIKHNTCPIFVTYHKREEINESTKYNDYFISRHKFSWMTRNRVKLDSAEVLKIKAYKESKLRILLFVKKSDGEGSDFYYVGEMEPYEYNQETILDNKNIELPIVNIKFKLLQPVDERIYDYLTT
jgi:superfamily II DNA or RNA helicase/HKD family nuclease